MPTLKELILQKEKCKQDAAELMATIRTQLDAFDETQKEIDKQIETKVSEIGKQKLSETQKDTGTVNFPLEGVTVKVTVSKTVKWDQEGLAVLCEKIKSAGDIPGNYIKTSFDVSETKFKEWPDAVKQAFMPHRTVAAGKPRYEYTIIENNDAPF
jgi:uncharacterized protein